MYFSEATDGNVFERLAASSPISLPRINPIFYTPHPENKKDWFITAESQWQPNEYGVEEYSFNLIKIHLDKNALGNLQARDWILERALGKVKWEMHRLRNAGIPVFIDERDEISLHPSEVQSYIWNYSIPESMLYKRFFALHDFDTAVKEAAAHARQKIHEFIDNW